MQTNHPGPDAPDISVVLVIGNHRRRARRAIDSVLRQEFDGRVEVLIVDLADPLNSGPLEVNDERLRPVIVPASTTFGEARAEAVRAARGPVIAFLEEHCVALPGWTAALVQAHRESWAGVGAEVHNANPGVGWSDAMYLMGYSAWMPPAKRGEAPLTATHNTSYKTALLRDLGQALPDLLTAEPLLQEALQRQGQRLLVEPEARFKHENETSLSSASVLYWWNRSLGRLRAEANDWGRIRKLTYLLLLPFVPFRRMLRLGLYFVRFRRSRLLSLLRQAPRIWVLDLLAATGLAVGMLVGSPADDARFTELELRGERKER